MSTRVSRFLGFMLEALAAVFSHTKAAESVLTKNYEEHVSALLQYFELDFGDDRDRQREFFKQVSLSSYSSLLPILYISQNILCHGQSIKRPLFRDTKDLNSSNACYGMFFPCCLQSS